MVRKSIVVLIGFFLKYDRDVDPKDKLNFDCYCRLRTIVRPVPGSCYWTTTTPTRSNEFWRFWGQMGPDIMYTFGNVLYNSQYENLHLNRLWFLKAYVKTIASNPLDIVAHIQELSIYLKNYNQLNSRVMQLESLVAHMFNNKGTFVDNNIVLNNKPVITRVCTRTLFDDNASDKGTTTSSTSGNIQVSNLDKETNVT